MTSGALRSSRPVKLVLAAVLLLTVVRGLSTLGGWYCLDDYSFIGWVLEHLHSPGAAFKADAVVLGHRRPATLVAWWTGLHLSDGDFWGPQVVVVVLHLAGVLGVMALATTLSGRRAAAPWVGLLVLGQSAVNKLLGWASFVNSAGEIAFGLWSLVAVVVALRRRSGVLLGLGIGLGAVAGLFKEPGWVIYPVGVLALCWRERRTAGRLSVVGAAGTLVVGAAGFLLTHASENVSRYRERLSELATWLPQQVDGYLAGMVSAWPAEPSRSGIPAVLLAVVLWRDLALARRGDRSEHLGTAWLWAAGATSALWMWMPSTQGGTLAALLTAVVVLRLRAPPLELLVLGAALAVMAPAPMQADVVHVLVGLFTLIAFVAAGTVDLVEDVVRAWSGPRKWWVRGAAIVVAVLGLAQLGAGIGDDSNQRRYDLDRAVLFGLGGIASLVQPTSVLIEGVDGTLAKAGPLVGVSLPELESGDVVPIYLPMQLTLFAPPKSVDDGLLARAWLLLESGAGDARVTMDLDPGFYALLVVPPPPTPPIYEQLSDECGHWWKRVTMVDNNSGVSATPFWLEPGCGPVTWRGGAPGAAYAIAPLPLIDVSLPSASVRRAPLVGGDAAGAR